MEKLYITIGQKIRNERKAQEMTLEDLSNEAKIDWSFLARIETGKTISSVKTLYTISKVLGISLSQLFDDKSISVEFHTNRRLINTFEKLSDKNKQKALRIIKLMLE